MRLELRRVDPMRAANIGAMVYGLLLSAFALIAAPFFLLVGALAPSGGAGPQPAVFAAVLLVMYPIMGVVMGWLSGLLTSAIYNFVIRWSGGLLLEVDSVAGSTAGGLAPAAAE
jgi:hypothetical protein